MNLNMEIEEKPSRHTVSRMMLGVKFEVLKVASSPRSGYGCRQSVFKSSCPASEMRLTIDHLSLFAQPALGGLIPPLQDDVIALNTASKIVPRRRNERVLALEVLDNLVARSLLKPCLSADPVLLHHDDQDESMTLKPSVVLLGPL